MLTLGESAAEWQPGDDPETHPMWEEQVELEYGMMRAGANAFRDRVIIASEKNQMATIKPVQDLMVKWVPGVAEQIKAWCRMWEKKRGVTPAVLPIMQTIDPYMAALVGLRSILNVMSSDWPQVQSIAMDIGRTIEYEQRVRAWEGGSKSDAALYHSFRREQRANKATSNHLRRASINRFNHHLKVNTFEEVSWDAWPASTVFRVGWEVMDAVIRHTGWFQVISDPQHIHRRAMVKSAMYVLRPAEGLTEWLASALDRAEIMQPDFRPTVMPPKRWSTTRDGGYWTPYVRTPRLIRFKVSSEDQREGAADEYDAQEYNKVTRAVNAFQETAYRINAPILEVFSKVWTELRWSRDKAYLPELNDRELPPRTPRMLAHRAANKGKLKEEWTPPDPETEEEIIQWKRRASRVHAFNATRMGRIHQAQSILRLAEQFVRYDAIYYPHVLDFRGRYYPVPFYLHPQGTDLARGLLTYADAMPVTEENGGIRWLAISLASNWGHDKLPFEDRIRWVYENEELFRLIAADPYANNAWFHEADKPWQTLAGILDWVAYLDAEAAGREHWSSIPVMIDGTCNGIQHLSAIVRDRIGGEHVNLTPSDRPRDIYKFVAEDLQETVERIAASGGAQGELAKWWLRVCDGELPRSLTKRQVMVLPYGGTKESFFGYTRSWVYTNVPETERDDPEVLNRQVVFLATHMWDSVRRTVRAAEEVMGWLKDCAREAAIADQPIFWVVPSGFTVRHFYGELSTTRVKLSLEGKVVKISLGERSPKLSVKEQLQGIAPNFIHSLDASCLTECVNLCLDAGITSITAVHDAYGTHAANMDALAQLTREAFVKTHEEDVLGAFRAACIEVIVDEMLLKDPHLDPLEAFEKADAKLPAPLDVGDLDLSEVLHSPYFFH